jgi:hypothetical protein
MNGFVHEGPNVSGWSTAPGGGEVEEFQRPIEFSIVKAVKDADLANRLWGGFHEQTINQRGFPFDGSTETRKHSSVVVVHW